MPLNKQNLRVWEKWKHKGESKRVKSILQYLSTVDSYVGNVHCLSGYYWYWFLDCQFQASGFLFNQRKDLKSVYILNYQKDFKTIFYQKDLHLPIFYLTTTSYSLSILGSDDTKWRNPTISNSCNIPSHSLDCPGFAHGSPPITSTLQIPRRETDKFKKGKVINA